MNSQLRASACYCRVSTEDQEQNGSSLQYQVQACHKFAQENNLFIGKRMSGEDAIFEEQFSGAYYDRPLLSELLSLVKSGRISSVIFTKRDRVARDQYTFQRIKKEIEEAGGKMYFAEEKLTGDIAIDSFMGSTIIGFAEWERIQIQRRTHSGKVQNSREGRWSFSYVPYGYIKNPTTKFLEIYEDEAHIVKLIYRLYLEEGYTLDGLARYLTNEKIPPPSLSSKGTNNQKSIASSRKNSSGQWIASTIYRILERGELYSGTYTAFRDMYKKVGGKTIRVGERNKDEWVVIQVPSLISLGQGEDALEKLEHNRRFAKKRSVRSYLLRGKLLCDCENPHHHMVGYTGQKAKRGEDKKILIDTEGNKIKDYYTNYRCVLFDPSKAGEERRCKNHISGLKVERIVLDTLKELFLNPESLFTYASERDSKNNTRTIGDEGEIDYNELVEKLKTLFKKNERIEELFVDGTISKERMREMKEGVETEQEKLNKTLAREEAILKQEAFSISARATWEEIRNEVGNMVEVFFREASQEELQSIVDLLVDRVVLTHEDKKHVVIRLKIPFDLFIADRYYKDEGIYADNEYGKPTCIGTSQNLVPKAFSLGELSKPIITKEVVFDEKGEEEGNGKYQSGNKDGKDKDDESKKGGKGGGTGGSNGSTSPISSAISKMVGYLKEKYHQSCRYDHEKSKLIRKNEFLFFCCFGDRTGIRAVYEKCPKAFRKRGEPSAAESTQVLSVAPGKIKIRLKGRIFCLFSHLKKSGFTYTREVMIRKIPKYMNTPQKSLSQTESRELLGTLRVRFEKNMHRHTGREWEKVEAKIEANPEKLWSLSEMEATGGEPDVVGYDEATGEYIFIDCSPESPLGRRSLCYDRVALDSRKENKPKSSVGDMAKDMGIEPLTEEEYRALQRLGEFDMKTSSWIATPADMRKLGGALFMDRRYEQVFVYHNGAESYYAARGFRGSLRI